MQTDCNGCSENGEQSNDEGKRIRKPQDEGRREDTFYDANQD